MSSFLSPTTGDGSLSPNRHWKRGLGREGTPLGKRDRSIDLGNTESIRKSKALSLLPGNEKPITIEVEEVVKFLTNVCNHMTDKETVFYSLISNINFYRKHLIKLYRN